MKNKFVKQIKGLPFEKTAYFGWFKIYAEQLGLPGDASPEEMQAALRKRISNIDKKHMVVAIVHYRDEVTTDDDVASCVKHHVHILIWTKNYNEALKVRTWCNKLDIKIRIPNFIAEKVPLDIACTWEKLPDRKYMIYPLDDNDTLLWKKHGWESWPIRYIAEKTAYLIHNTDKARQDGKAPYSWDEVISNWDIEDVKKIATGYSLHGEESGAKPSLADQQVLDSEAYNAGKGLCGWDEWYATLPLVVRKMRTLVTVLQESYVRGVKERVEKDGHVTRLCIFLQGPADIGKTFFFSHLPGAMLIDGGHTGMYDKVTEATETLVIDDYTIPNIKNTTDDKMTTLYRRTSNNPYWCGTLLVVLSNKTFDEWLTDCKLVYVKGSEDYKAFTSRFYICHVNEAREIVVDSPASRGTPEELKKKASRFEELKSGAEKSMKEYAAMRGETLPSHELAAEGWLVTMPEGEELPFD